MAARPRFAELLSALVDGGCRFVVVGGVAAVLEGAPISTFDLDLVHARDVENVARLLQVLESLEATYRDPGGRVIHPEARLLEGTGHHLLDTSLGALDLLGEIGQNQGFEELKERTVEYRLENRSFLVLALDALIELKQLAGREKDLAVLPLLRKTLEERQGRDG